MGSIGNPATLAALEKKYAEERDKRLRHRPDETAQCMSIQSPETQDLGQDPWVDYEAIAKHDPPLKDGGSIKFLIVGAGINGCLYAARLIEAGFSHEEIVLVDIGGGVGGTWYWNRYPGLMCDVEGYCYLPLLEETGYVPKQKYSPGYEIRGQLERIASHYNFQFMFCIKVDKQVWNETKGRWMVDLTQSLGHVRQPTKISVEAQFMFLASGLIFIPKIPNAPGFNDFRPHKQVFHTSRWNYGITGGSEEQPNLVNLQDKRVAIIGTGATAVQAVPHLAKWAKHLYVIQRTPSYCGERHQKATTPEEWAKVADGPGWQRRRAKNLNSWLTGDPEPVDLVNDGWSQNQARSGFLGSTCRIVDPEMTEEHYNKLLETDLPFAEALRARIDQTVKNPETAEKLKPWYPGWCKRPTFNDDYLEAFNRPNVTLVDTDGKGIERYTARGIVVAGQELDVDVLVLATGFNSGAHITPSTRQAAPIIGTGGRAIDDKWQKPDFGTLFGIATNGFPNFFACHISGQGTTYNLTSSFDVASRLTAHIISEASKQSGNADKVIVDVSKEAEDRWGEEVARRAAWFSVMARCTPGYFNGEGAASRLSPAEAALQAKKAIWGGGIIDYQCRIEEYMSREEKIEGFEVKVAA